MVRNKAKWQSGFAEWFGAEPNTVNFSVVFSWDAAKAYSRAVWWKQQGYDVRVGGPGVFVLKKDFESVAEVGGSIPDAVWHHNQSATFASRGCPVGCYFCIVPAMEGREFTLLPDFPVRPILCDNNLSALPDHYQDHIVGRYLEEGVQLLDANSGFEPQTFDETVYHRWSQINRGAWRFAYDETKEGPDVERVCQMLSEVPAGRKRVYVLIGNEPFEACMDRIKEVISWGAEPHVQPIMKLNAREKKPWVRYDWSPQLLRDVARWTNKWIWRTCSFDAYTSGYRRPIQIPIQQEALYVQNHLEVSLGDLEPGSDDGVGHLQPAQGSHRSSR